MELKLLILIMASLIPQPEPPTCEERGGKLVLWRMDQIHQQPSTTIKVPVYKCAMLVDSE